MKEGFLKNGLIQIHLAVLLFGFSGLFGKFLTCSPFFIVFGRTFFAAVILLLIILCRSSGDKTGQKLQADILGWFVLQGLLLAVHWWAFFHAIQISTVAIGLLTFSTFPLFVTFMEPVFFKEPLTFFNIGTAIAVFIGIALVIPDLDFSNQFTRGGLWGIFSGFTFALLALINRKNVRTRDPITVSFFQNCFAAFFLIWPVMLFDIRWPVVSDIFYLVVLGVLCTALAHTLFIGALSSISAQTASIISSLEPVYGILLAVLLLREIPGIKTVIGGLIIILTIFVAGRYKYGHSNI